MNAASPVRFLDLGPVHAAIGSELDAAMARVRSSGRYILGPEVEAFEAEWAAATGASYAVGVGSGLDALTLALRVLGVGPGDEVIVPSNTYIATWLAVSAVGAVPRPVDPDPESYQVEAGSARAALTARTRALLPVHLYGQPVDVEGFERLAEERNLTLVFDAAQAHGATARGRGLGGRGHATAWSFYPAKNLGALGDAGAVTTNDPAVAARLRRLRNYGSEQRYVHLERGMNTRLDELQAAALRVKLRHLAGWNQRRAEIARRYQDGLSPSGLLLPVQVGGTDPAWHLYVVRSPDRDGLQRHLERAGVETLIHYPVPPHRQLAYADLVPRLPPLPVAERLSAEVLSLPIGPHLTDHEVDRVIGALLRALPPG